MPERPNIRCAVYTRKSTEKGLEQEFNSLDAQRAAAEAYIASQKESGWVCLPERYDDGGYSGGNIERPAFQRLMADVEKGGIDCVLVYKIDRLSRSLLDFARIMETLDRHGISLVSVTQQFNTTSSMGKLTLNILLSFAQFEREIISERTRDKIAATRRMGKWSGGRPILGYDVAPGGGRLLVNEDEAERVRGIFEIYLERESLVEAIKAIDARGWVNKRWITKGGRDAGGKPFSKSSLFRFLSNILYLGKITLGEEVYEGEHPAIIDAEVFQRVQALLRRNGASGGKHVRNKFGALLKGLLYCGSCGCTMGHTHTLKKDKGGGNRRYRYYVCLKTQKRGWHDCPTKSIPAPEIEKFVVEQIRCIGRDGALAAETIRQMREQAQERAQGLEAEKRALERELKRHNADMQRLVGESAGPERMADLQERIRLADRRATEVREELLALGRDLLDEREATRALALFDPVWDSLTPREQARIIKLLVERVEYDGAKGQVRITFHTTGIGALAEELNNRKATA